MESKETNVLRAFIDISVQKEKVWMPCMCSITSIRVWDGLIVSVPLHAVIATLGCITQSSLVASNILHGWLKPIGILSVDFITCAFTLGDCSLTVK